MILISFLVLLMLVPHTAVADDAVPLKLHNINDDLYSLALNGDQIWCGGYTSVAVFDPLDNSFQTATGTLFQYFTGPVYLLCVDSNGMAWVKMVNYNDRYTLQYNKEEWIYRFEDFSGKEINFLFNDRSGLLWAGTKNYGIYSLGDGETRNYMPDDALLKITDCAYSHDGALWCASREGVWRYYGNSWQRFTKADGLEVESARCIHIGNDDMIWVGTGDGLFRYDGISWKRYQVQDGIINSYINDIVADKTGNVWIATNGGVSKYDGSQWTSYTSKKELVDNRPTDMAVDAHDTVWFCFDRAARGVVSFDGSEWKWHTTFNTTIPTNAITCIAADDNGRVWMGCENGLICYDGHDYTLYSSEHGLQNAEITSLYNDPNNTLWIGYKQSAQSGITRYDGVSFRAFTTADSFPADYYSAIAVSDDGTLCLASSEGVHLFDGATWDMHPKMNRLASKAINDVTQSPDDILWFATDDGLTRFDGASWYTYAKEKGLSDNRLVDVEASPAGDIWCLTDSLQLVCFNGTSFNSFSTAITTTGPHPFDIAVTNDGTVWGIVESDPRVFRFDGSHWIGVMPESPELREASYRDILIDSHDTITIASDRGLVRIKNGVWSVFPIDGPRNNLIFDMSIDKNNTIWTAGDRGIDSYDGKTWTHRKVYDDTDSVSVTVRSVTIDRNDVKWFYTDEPAFVSYDGKTWEYYHNDACNDYAARSYCAVDNNDVKWIASLGHGIFSFDGRDFRGYSSDIGVNNLEVSTLFIDSSNRKWFPLSNNGVLCYDDETWRHYSTETGFFSDSIWEIREDSQCRVWLLSRYEGIAMLDGDSWTVFTAKNGLPNNAVSALAIDSQDIVWIRCGNCVASYDGESWHRHKTDMEFISYGADSIIIDRFDNKWIIGSEHVWFFDGVEWTVCQCDATFLSRHGLNDISLVDYNNTCWFIKDWTLASLRRSSPFLPGTSNNLMISLLGSFPNPFNAETAIDFALAEWGPVGMTVYNIMGQRVRRFPPASLPAGKNKFIWDGCDDSGVKVSSGVYIYRIEKGGRKAVGRMMFVK